MATTPGDKAAQSNGNKSDVLAQMQQRQVENGNAVNAALLQKPTQAVKVIPKAPVEARAFKGPYAGYQSFLTAKGNTYTFYEGFIKTDDPEVIAECENMPGVVEVEVSDSIPTPPDRTRGRRTPSGPVATFSDSTTISPLELLQRSVGNSTHVPQAAESSTTSSS